MSYMDTVGHHYFPYPAQKAGGAFARGRDAIFNLQYSHSTPISNIGSSSASFTDSLVPGTCHLRKAWYTSATFVIVFCNCVIFKPCFMPPGRVNKNGAVQRFMPPGKVIQNRAPNGGLGF